MPNASNSIHLQLDAEHLAQLQPPSPPLITVKKRSCDPCILAKKGCDGSRPCKRCSNRKNIQNCLYSDKKYQSKAPRKLVMKPHHKDIEIEYWKQRAIHQSICCQKWKDAAIKFKNMHADILRKKNKKIKHLCSSK